MAYKADYHIHTRWSLDSETPMQDMIKQGIHLKFDELCFTDHMDIDYPGQLVFEVDYDKYIPQFLKYKNKYRDRILLKCGVEVGLQPHNLHEIENFINNYNFDYIIGSIHVIQKEDPYIGEYFINKTQKEAYEGYFKEILQIVKNCDSFHCLGHLDYVIRYYPGENKGYNYPDYQDIIDEIIKTLIENNKGIEVNSSGLRKGLKNPLPQYDVIQRYKDLGGEIITTGSDAHKASELGSDFTTIYDYLSNIGFDYITTFSQGVPSFKKID